MLERRIRSWLQQGQKSSGSQDVPDLQAAIGTEIGLVRKDNQDRSIIARYESGSAGSQSFILAVVCDGIGGMLSGGECAEIALSAMLTSLVQSREPEITARLKRATESANEAVFREFRGRGGTTLVAVFVSQDIVVATTVGDSRLYFQNGRTLKQVSTDDTIAGELLRLKGTTVSLSALEPSSRHLAQFIGMGADVEPRFYRFPLRDEGDTFVLTSDGAHMISERLLDSLNANAESRDRFVSRVLAVSRWSGGYDNASIIHLSCKRQQNRLNGVERRLELWSSSNRIEYLDFGPYLDISKLLIPNIRDKKPKPTAPKKTSSKPENLRPEKLENEAQLPLSSRALEIQIGNDTPDRDQPAPSTRVAESDQP